ncbi:related to ERP2 - p24 protein involved in membrane trafficking [Melanopsichium pennsylvanicum]|uniref:Related to ERP2 - p24 protein involved in membrane trafficking n=2 Tax=Melanopsichium pennsylvanicum TaxID=63383 RepID=A0AAJ5C4S6_9BASI|nr:related to ERP2-p24 protein involved in membrane trafficking [Melanopsichium pennsylvanicum 4]SNX83970.1 related to ERP2 - p24 protein involved in membrane trafficking [Melanopsichium pennsylvanicum]
MAATTSSSMSASTFTLIFSTILLVVLTLAPSCVSAAALTTLVEPHERSCFYAWVDAAGEKVGFYFAVQSGGHFDIDYTVHDPDNKLIIDGQKERQLDIIFTGNTIGEYTFCFENTMSTLADKLIDFDITVESEPRLDLPIQPSKLLKEHSAPLEEMIGNLQDKLTQVGRTQRYFRVRENRNFDTVQSTQSKIFWYSVVESVTMLGVSAAQVYIVRALFEKGSTKRYRV